MSHRPALLWIAACAVLTLGCNGPFVVFPGGALAGEATATLPDWPAGEYGTAQLETNPGEPYSVNIAYTVLEDGLYINAGDTETRWVKNMIADPDVRLQVDGVLYEARAERVNDPDVLDVFADAWTSQSMFRRDPRELEQVWLYRIVERTPSS